MAVVGTPRPRAAERNATRRRGRYGESVLLPLLFVGPHLILFLLFAVFATLLGFWISLHKFDYLQRIHLFVGPRNYQHLLLKPGNLLHDEFIPTMIGAFTFVVTVVPALVILGLLLANLLNTKVRARGFWRTCYVLPWPLTGTVVSLIWYFIFQGPDEGVVNLWLKALRQPQVSFESDPLWGTLIVLGRSVWWQLGFNIIVLLAGLQTVSRSLYEAAQVDGAGAVGRFRHVTLPGIKPMLLFALLVDLIGAFVGFGGAGSEGGSASPVVSLIWNTGWQMDNMGMAATMSFVFGALIVVLSLVLFRFFFTERA